MGCNPGEISRVSEKCPSVKVHRSMCKELIVILEKLLYLIPKMESARPGGMSGMAELCSINNLVDKAKQLIQHWADSSKLYLVVTGEASVSRCERIRDGMSKSLCNIQTMVPEPLSGQIVCTITSLGDVKFVMDFPDEESGKALLSLLRQTDVAEEAEFKAFQIAASRLHLTSSKELLMERRCIQKLMDKFSSTDAKKGRILHYLMYLLKTYGKQVTQVTSDHEESACELPNEIESVCDLDLLVKENPSCDVSLNENVVMHVEDRLKELPEKKGLPDSSVQDMIPEKFRCPLSSKLMYDPVIITSGQTYDRSNIEKWFNQGNRTCPKTKVSLQNLCMIPNSSMKELISEWCQTHGVSHPGVQFDASYYSSDSLNFSTTSSMNSVAGVLLGSKNIRYIPTSNTNSCVSVFSHDSSFSDSSHFKVVEEEADVYTHTQVFTWSDDYQTHHSFSGFSYDSYMKFILKLSELQSELQSKALEDLRSLLIKDDKTRSLMLSDDFVKPLMRFLKGAYDSSDVSAQKTGLQIILAFEGDVSKRMPLLDGEVFHLLTCFMDSEFKLEALMIIRMLSSDCDCRSSIMASDIPLAIIKTLESGDLEFMEIALDILYQLSYVEVGSQIPLFRCVSKLVALLKEKQRAGACLKILRNLCDSEEGRTTIAESDSCLTDLVELLDDGSRDEQSDAVAILLSVCSHSSEYCSLLSEDIVLSLVDISVNGNIQGKEDAKQLLQLLKDPKTPDRNSHDYMSYSESQPSSPHQITSTVVSEELGEKNHTESAPSLDVHPGSPSVSNTTPSKKSTTSRVSGFLRRKKRYFTWKSEPLTSGSSV